jgi:hypothetical protein
MTPTHAAEKCVTYAVTSRNNRKGVASGVLCGSSLKGLGQDELIGGKSPVVKYL